MSLEERIRQSVGNALDDVRGRVEAEVRAIAQELIASAAEEQQAAVTAAREEAAAEIRRDLERQLADAEARAEAGLHERLLEARTEEREGVTRELTERLTAEADARVRAATEEAERTVLAATEEAERKVRAALDEAARLGRVLDAVRGLDGAASLTDVLDALGQAVARGGERAALVVIRGERVQGWTLTGFGPLDAQPRSIDLPLSETGLIASAAGAMRVVLSDEGAPASLGFAELEADRTGLAVPVLVGGRAVAVVCAEVDREAGTARGGLRDGLEILARHAGRCLESLTAQRAAQAVASPRAASASARVGAPA